MLPKATGKAAELNREVLESVVQRVPLLADDRLHGLQREAKEVVEARYEQERLQIGFNAKCLLEFLGVVRATTSIRM